MEMPNVHKCATLLLENDQLKKKLRRLKQQNMDLQCEVNDIKDKQRMDAMMKDFVTTRNMETQTDPPKALNTQTAAKKQEERSIQENEKVSKLLLMHNSLMKRYEKELKVNMQHVDAITTLNLKVNELEQKLREAQIKIHQGESKLQASRKTSGRRRTQSLSSEDDTELSTVLKEMQKVKKDRDRLVQDKRKLKDELKGLDHGFFEEVEDLKYALQQSGRLNQEYEKSLRKLCSQSGVPYPHPERRLPPPDPTQ
jgi:small-conductance mechanosensitive channel